MTDDVINLRKKFTFLVFEIEFKVLEKKTKFPDRILATEFYSLLQ